MENLITLCGNHHRAHHRGLLKITGPDLELEFEQIDNVPDWIKRKYNLYDCFPS